MVSLFNINLPTILYSIVIPTGLLIVKSLSTLVFHENVENHNKNY